MAAPTTSNKGIGLLYQALGNVVPNGIGSTNDALSTALAALGLAMGPDTQPVWLGAESATGVTMATDTPAYAVTSNLPRWTFTATGNNAFSWSHAMQFPIGNSTQGYRITGGTSYYTVGTATPSALAMALNKVTFATPPTGAAVATTGTFTRTFGSSYAIAWTVDTPIFLDGSTGGYMLSYTGTGVNTAVFTYFGTLVTLSKVSA